MPAFRLQMTRFRPLPPSSGNPVSPSRAANSPQEMHAWQGVARNTRMLACHSVGEGSNMIAYFCGKPQRVGEKDNYDYLVRWVHNPRERTRLQPFRKARSRSRGLASQSAFVFDRSRSQSRRVRNWLSTAHCHAQSQAERRRCRDVASYLITLKHADAPIPAVTTSTTPS